MCINILAKSRNKEVSMAPKKASVISMAKVATKLAALQVKADKVSAEIKLLSAEVLKAAAAPAEKPATASKKVPAKKPPITKTATKKTPGRKPATKKTTASTTSTIAK